MPLGVSQPFIISPAGDREQETETCGKSLPLSGPDGEANVIVIRCVSLDLGFREGCLYTMLRWGGRFDVGAFFGIHVMGVRDRGASIIPNCLLLAGRCHLGWIQWEATHEAGEAKIMPTNRRPSSHC